jgi:hypothetical protein
MKLKQTHEGIIEDLAKDLIRQYSLLIPNMHYPYVGKEKGEIDLVGIIEPTIWDIFEIKCNYRMDNKEKALKQLERAYKYLNDYVHIKTIQGFYVAIKHNKYTSERIIERII